MSRTIWDLNLSACDYPDTIKKIYFKNCYTQRTSFCKWIDKIGVDFKDNIDWWSTVSSSRNPNFSKLFHYICVVETIKNFSKKKISLDVFTNSENLYKLLTSKSLKNISIKLEEKNITRRFYFHYLKSLIFQIFLFIFIKLFVKKNKICSQVLIHTYPSNDLKKVERLFQFKDKNDHKKYTFIPSFIIKKNIFFLIKLIFFIKKKNYVFKEHYLKFSDLFFSFCGIFRFKIFKKKYFKFDGYDFSDIIFSEISNLRNFNSYIIGILNFKFVEKLKIRNIKINKTICWYENHELKGWNYAFRKFFPKTKTLGYQGFSPLIPLMNTIPTKLETYSKVIPETIIILSNKYKNVLTEFTKNIKIKVGPALVFKDIYLKFKKKRKIKFLVILTEIKDNNINLLSWLNNLNEKGVVVDFYIKIPKILNIKSIIHEYKKNINFKFTNQSLPELLKKTDFAIIGGLGHTSVAIEAISYRCKILTPVIDPLDIIYFKKINISKNFYKIFHTKKDFYNFFNKKLYLNYKKISQVEYNNFIKKFFSRNTEKIFY